MPCNVDVPRKVSYHRTSRGCLKDARNRISLSVSSSSFWLMFSMFTRFSAYVFPSAKRVTCFHNERVVHATTNTCLDLYRDIPVKRFFWSLLNNRRPYLEDTGKSTLAQGLQYLEVLYAHTARLYGLERPRLYVDVTKQRASTVCRDPYTSLESRGHGLCRGWDGQATIELGKIRTSTLLTEDYVGPGELVKWKGREPAIGRPTYSPLHYDYLSCRPCAKVVSLIARSL